MKRRPHGVNLDDGVALTSAEDFDRLYVDARSEESQKLRDWLADPEARALILAGQIGSGKTTLLHKMLRSVPPEGIVRVEFDQTPLEETHDAFLAVLFGYLLKEALALNCTFDGLGVALSDFDDQRLSDWHSVRNILLSPPSSVADAGRVRAVYAVFGAVPAQGLRACDRLIDVIKMKIGASPPIIAEGVDKFLISRAGYQGLGEILNFLSAYKTLYEANAVHLFDAGRTWVGSQKLFIGPLSDEMIAAMYEKRLGSYEPLYHDSFPLLVQFAGGNARQALRLLNAYYFRRTQRGDKRDTALAIAAHRVTQDLLQFGFERFPSNTLMVLKRDGFVESSVLSHPQPDHTREEARDILYHNWAFLCSVPGPGSTRWPVAINPLVSDAVAWERGTPEPFELAAVRRWARDHHTSPMGLSMPEDEKGRPEAWEKIWRELSSSESSEDKLNIVRLLEEVAFSLFSTYRQDRIMISYRDSENLRIGLDYLIGKAASYGIFECREIHLRGGGGADPMLALLEQINEKDEATVYAVFMEGEWTAEQLEILERLRDRFVDIDMLWFVEHSAQLRYLPHWPQFRQLLRFYVLEDDFLAALSKAEIEADLSVLSDLPEPGDNGILRLRRVLEYLQSNERKA